MRYLLILVAILGISTSCVYVLRRVRNSRAKLDELRKRDDWTGQLKLKEEITWTLVWGIAGIIALLWAGWFWGVQGIREDQLQDRVIEEWFSSYDERHQTRWNEICREIFFYDIASGLLYQNGQAFSVDWCYGLWTPPEKPISYSTWGSSQPERQEPFAINAVFNKDRREFCVDVINEYSCFYDFDVLGW